jgi:hypothetical protein
MGRARYHLLERELCHDAFDWTIDDKAGRMQMRQGPDSFAERMCPLHTRAWAFQERMLGTRILHFTAEVVWEWSVILG